MPIVLVLSSASAPVQPCERDHVAVWRLHRRRPEHHLGTEGIGLVPELEEVDVKADQGRHASCRNAIFRRFTYVCPEPVLANFNDRSVIQMCCTKLVFPHRSRAGPTPERPPAQVSPPPDRHPARSGCCAKTGLVFWSFPDDCPEPGLANVVRVFV